MLRPYEICFRNSDNAEDIVIMIGIRSANSGGSAIQRFWTIIPLATIAYDAASRSATLPSVVRVSISMILYGILWADLFFVLERAIVLHRNLSGKAEIMIAAGFAVAGTLFIVLGVYRHWMTAKE